MMDIEKPNCIGCHHIHPDNGNCTGVGGFCTAVPAAHCPLIPELRAENERLRAELEQARTDCAVAEKNHADCIDERDALLNAFRGFIQSGHLCEYCAETLKDDPACSACEKWSKFQWRGPEED